MGARRKSREAALQYLFQEDFKVEENLGEQSFSEKFSLFSDIYQISRKARPYAERILAGLLERREEVDRLISDAASNWRLTRIAATDRNILRLAVYEMLAEEDVPDQVAINEAVEIAKRFCGEDSPAFINGVLDAVRLVLRS
ncbi:MAG: transcription antitermination factor NusB [Desulfopila sp.]